MFALYTISDSLIFLVKSKSGFDPKKDPKKQTASPKDGTTAHITAKTFAFRELALATKNFRPECLLGEGGFGRVYKGQLESTGQVSLGSFDSLYVDVMTASRTCSQLFSSVVFRIYIEGFKRLTLVLLH